MPFFLHLLFGALLAAVEFPGPPPGPAHASADGQDFRLSNNVIAATWRLSNGTLRPATLTDQLNGQAFQQTDSEIFRLHSGAPIPGADLAYVRLRFSSETVDVLASADNENWTTLASFSRADFPDSPALLRLGKIDARTGRPIDYYLPGDYGECRLDDFLVESASGAVLVEDHFEELSSAWTPNLSGQFGVSVFSSNGWLVVQGRANCRAFVERAVPAGAAQFSCRIQKYTDLGQTWAPALCLNWTDSKFVLVGYRGAPRTFTVGSSRAGDQIAESVPAQFDVVASGMTLISGPQIQPGQISASFAGAGFEVDWRAVLPDGANYLRQIVSVRNTTPDALLRAIEVLDWSAPAPRQRGSVPGSPVVAGQMFFGMESPFAGNILTTGRVQSVVASALPLGGTNAYEFSSVTGVWPAGQLRRSFLYYLERERARPYSGLLHYNNYFQTFLNVDQSIILDSIEQFDRQMRQLRGVALDAYAIDDGWDDPAVGFWEFDATKFPEELAPIRDRLAETSASLGLWISPLGGYDQAAQRTQRAREEGILPATSNLDLSISSYYDWFLRRHLQFIEQDHVRYFKWDVAGKGLNPHFMALARLGDELHRRAPGVFLNATVGAWASPFWLRHVDGTWRGGSDWDMLGPGNTRERSITYRDAQTYRNIVALGPLYPLNSIMVGGITYYTDGYSNELRTDLLCLFGSGTSLQELYITPSLMSPAQWDRLAQIAAWARSNETVLADTHWVGADPATVRIYGWASWKPPRAILVLRNPAAEEQTIALEPTRVFELPAGSPRRYKFRTLLDGAKIRKFKLRTGKTTIFKLQPFEVLVLEGEARQRVRR